MVKPVINISVKQKLDAAICLKVCGRANSMTYWELRGVLNEQVFLAVWFEVYRKLQNG